MAGRYIFGALSEWLPFVAPNILEYEDPTKKKCQTPVILGIGRLDSSCWDICSISLAQNYPFLLLGCR